MRGALTSRSLTIRLPKPPAAPDNGVEKGGAGEPKSRREAGPGRIAAGAAEGAAGA